MPKLPRTPEQVASIKENILETALKIIIQEGFAGLSMRNIASNLGISATTIYNYFSDRDELYFMIRIKGFDLLFQRLSAAFSRSSDPRERLKLIILSYLDFGMTCPDYYDIMFLNRSVPKYLDCIGTDLEPIAGVEKESTLRSFNLVLSVLSDIRKLSSIKTEKKTDLAGEQLWCDLNGIVSLYNSRLLKEINGDSDETIGLMAEEIYRRFCG